MQPCGDRWAEIYPRPRLLLNMLRSKQPQPLEVETGPLERTILVLLVCMEGAGSIAWTKEASMLG